VKRSSALLVSSPLIMQDDNCRYRRAASPPTTSRPFAAPRSARRTLDDYLRTEVCRLDRAAALDGGGLVLTNLLSDLAALGMLLERAASKQWWLDAHLVAAGINQIAEDYLRAAYPLDDAASLLTGAGSRAGRLAGRVAAASALAARRIAARSEGFRRTLEWQRQVAVLVDDLAT
jgi:hypothetical protein